MRRREKLALAVAAAVGGALALIVVAALPARADHIGDIATNLGITRLCAEKHASLNASAWSLKRRFDQVEEVYHATGNNEWREEQRVAAKADHAKLRAAYRALLVDCPLTPQMRANGFADDLPD